MPNHQLITFRTEKLRAHQLTSVERHNSRAMPVPNADPSIPGGVRQFFGASENLNECIREVLDAHGAPRPSRQRYIAFEAVYGLPVEAPCQPTEQEFCDRALAHASEVFGSERIVAAWLHSDEKSRHVHMVVVPLVRAWPPGLRKAFRSGQMPPWRVSWAIFSGSDNCVTETLPDGRKKRRNPVMAEWQTKWAEQWRHYGFERGAPSSRPHIKPAHLHGTTAQIQELAESSLRQILDLIRTHPWEGEVLGKEFIGLALAQLVGKQLGAHVEALAELARRGAQLPNERDARIETAHRLQTLKEQFAAVSGQVAKLNGQVAQLAAMNAQKDARIHAITVECEHHNARANYAEQELQIVFDQHDRNQSSTPRDQGAPPAPKTPSNPAQEHS